MIKIDPHVLEIILHFTFNDIQDEFFVAKLKLNMIFFFQNSFGLLRSSPKANKVYNLYICREDHLKIFQH